MYARPCCEGLSGQFNVRPAHQAHNTRRQPRTNMISLCISGSILALDVVDHAGLHGSDLFLRQYFEAAKTAIRSPVSLRIWIDGMDDRKKRNEASNAMKASELPSPPVTINMPVSSPCTQDIINDLKPEHASFRRVSVRPCAASVAITAIEEYLKTCLPCRRTAVLDLGQELVRFSLETWIGWIVRYSSLNSGCYLGVHGLGAFNPWSTTDMSSGHVHRCTVQRRLADEE